MPVAGGQQRTGQVQCVYACDVSRIRAALRLFIILINFIVSRGVSLYLPGFYSFNIIISSAERQTRSFRET